MELFKLFGTIALNNQEANEEIEETTEKASGLGDKLKAGIVTAGKWGTAIAAGAAAAGAGVLKIATESAAAADEVDKMSQKIGLSKEGYQEWAYVLGQNGMDISSLQMGMKTLVTQMDGVISGSQTSIEMFDRLGLSVTDSTGAMKDQETMMNEVMIALADMPNGTEKARLAAELFGRSGAELMPMLNQGSGAMLELTQRAHDLGLIMSDDAVNAGVVLGDTMDDVKKSLGMLATELGVQLMPIVQMALDWVIEHMPEIKQFVSDAMTTVGTAIEKVKPIVQTVFRGISVLWESVLKPAFEGIVTFLSGVFTGNWKKAFQGLVNIVKSIFSGIVSQVKAPINQVIGFVNKFISGLNKLKIPDWVPGVGGKGINIPLIPKLEKGGILAKGQVGLLEGTGAEAVVPLDQNRAWINAVAQDMKAAGIGGQNDVLVNYMKQLIDMLTDYFPQLVNAAGHDIVTNDGVIVAHFAPLLNSELGKISSRKGRGR